MFIGRIKNGEGHAGHIAAEFAVRTELYVFGVVLGGRDIGFAHRQVGCFSDLKRQFAGFDLVEDFDRQIILGGLPRIRSDPRAGSQTLHRRLTIGVGMKHRLYGRGRHLRPGRRRPEQATDAHAQNPEQFLHISPCWSAVFLVSKPDRIADR